MSSVASSILGALGYIDKTVGYVNYARQIAENPAEHLANAVVNVAKDPVYNRYTQGGQVKGNHKVSEVTPSPLELLELARKKHPSDDAAFTAELRRQYGGKISSALNDKRLYASNPSRDYQKVEIPKWSEALQAAGGSWTVPQFKKIVEKAGAGEEWAQLVLSDYNQFFTSMGGEYNDDYKKVIDDNRGSDFINHLFPAENPVASQEEEPPVSFSPVDPPMVRPEDTPRASQKRKQDLDLPEARRRLTYQTQPVGEAPPTSAPTAAPTAAPTSAPEPMVVEPPAMATPDLNGASGGNDPSGSSNAFHVFKSTKPSYSQHDGGMTIKFGGTRLMYSWALDMRIHNVDGYGDFVPVGHTIPWDWIPFYCTPGEWNSLPWKTHSMSIKRVGVTITPMAKETQFNTASGTSQIASNEHFAMGHVAVGLNLREDIPGYGIRRIKNNESTSSLISTSSEAIDYKDLRKRYWGELSDMPYDGTKPNMYTNDKPRACSELGIREIETVGGMYVDRVYYNSGEGSNNKSLSGCPLLDRYITRFTFMPAIGHPIIQEEYVPKCGIINMQPHRILLENSRQIELRDGGLVRGSKYGFTMVKQDNRLQVNQIAKVNTTGSSCVGQLNPEEEVEFSRNTNVGTTVLRNIGSYHALVDKSRIFDSNERGDTCKTTQPSICFGMEPIRLINLTSSTPEYVNARAVWKIDYFIEISAVFDEPSYPFATNVNYNNVVFPANMYTSYIPRKMLNPLGWGTGTNTALPDKEIRQPSFKHGFERHGWPTTNATEDSVTLADVAGTNAQTPWVQDKGGLQTQQQT